jgi:hypothetical protein
MHYIKDIFEGNITKHAHDKFIRYSRGSFIGPLLKIKFTSNSVKLNASFHYVDEIVKLASEYLGNVPVHMKGSLVWNQDLSTQLFNLGIKYSKVSKSRGIFKYTLDNEIKIVDFIENMGNFNFLVSFKTGEVQIVTKSSFPKPNKEFTNDFCKATFPISLKDKILKEFAFDINEDKKKIKEINIKHNILISDLELPNIEDFERARREAKRIGELTREISTNNSESLIKKIKIKV